MLLTFTNLGFTDAILQWFSSYLADRTHYVSLSNHCSDFVPVHSGVPQGSVLGPILFTMYIKPLSTNTIIHHSFADDLQLHMSTPPDKPENVRLPILYYIISILYILYHIILPIVDSLSKKCIDVYLKTEHLFHHDCRPILMLLYIMLAYVLLFAALFDAVCLHNAYFFAIDF